MQTVVQIDGDAFTSILPRFATGSDQGLWNLHQRAVSTSLSYWTTLIGITRDLLAGLLKLITPGMGR